MPKASDSSLVEFALLDIEARSVLVVIEVVAVEVVIAALRETVVRIDECKDRICIEEILLDCAFNVEEKGGVVVVVVVSRGSAIVLADLSILIACATNCRK